MYAGREMRKLIHKVTVACSLALLSLAGSAVAEIPPEEEEILVANSDWSYALRRGFGQYLDLLVEGQTLTGERVLGRYDMEDCNYCEGLEDNCNQTGIRAHVLTSRFNPVVVAVCNVGEHSQRIRLYDPVIDPIQPIFARTGSYFLQYLAGENQLSINYDHEEVLVDDDGNGESEILYSVLSETWPENPFSLLDDMGFEPFSRSEIDIPTEHLLTPEDQLFLRQLQEIVDRNDLISLRNLLAEDVTVARNDPDESDGSDNSVGIEVFFDYWGLNQDSQNSWLWPVLNRLIEAGGMRSQTETGARLTLPFYQRLFPAELSSLSHGLVIGFKVLLRATPSASSAPLARISHEPALVVDEVGDLGG